MPNYSLQLQIYVSSNKSLILKKKSSKVLTKYKDYIVLKNSKIHELLKYMQNNNPTQQHIANTLLSLLAPTPELPQEISNQNSTDDIVSLKSFKSISITRLKSRPRISIPNSNLKLSKNPSIQIKSFTDFESNIEERSEYEDFLIMRNSFRSIDKCELSPLDQELIRRKRVSGQKSSRSSELSLRIEWMN